MLDTQDRLKDILKGRLRPNLDELFPETEHHLTRIDWASNLDESMYAYTWRDWRIMHNLSVQCRMHIVKFAVNSTTTEPSEAGGCYRARELEWRRRHAESLRRFTGQWVALEGETVIASGGDISRVVSDARDRGIQSPFVFYVDDTNSAVAKIGL